MLNSKLINDVYNNNIKTVLTNIEDNYVDEVSQTYKEMLENRYSDVSIKKEYYDKMLKIINDMEQKEWSNLSAREKKVNC